MSRLFIIGDTHFGHVKAATWRGFEGSTFDHDLHLIGNINRTCSIHDTLLFLGDIAFTKPAFHSAMSKINCKKQFILGNHDKFSIDLYRGYGKVLPFLCKTIEEEHTHTKYVFTHIPVHPNELIHAGGRWNVNIHAHLHDKSALGLGYTCVSAERINFTPIEFKQGIHEHNK